MYRLGARDALEADITRHVGQGWIEAPTDNELIQFMMLCKFLERENIELKKMIDASILSSAT